MPKKKLLSKHGDKLDRYRAHLLEKQSLNPTEKLMLEKYRKSWSLMGMGYSREQVVTVLMKEYSIALAQSYKIVKDSIAIYGDVMETNKKGMRHIMYENFMLAASLARKAGDFGGMIRATENAARLMDAYSQEVLNQDPSDFLQPVAIVFTSNPKVLQENQLKRQLPADTSAKEYDEYEQE